MDYVLLKIVHVSCVAATLALFLGRGVLMLRNSPLSRARVLRTVPHLIDTLLLASAIWMTVLSGQYPFAQAWLTAKLLALVVYIGAGMLALTYGHTRRARARAWIAALLAFAYIVSVALTRDPLPFLSP